MQQTVRKRFAILGAGPMGLMAAMEILKAGHEVDIYERDDRIGGMSAAFDFDGLQIERYYHFVCKTDDPLFELMQELGIAHTLKWTDTRMGFYCQGKLYKWGTPFALLGFDKLGWIDKFRYALHVMRTKSIKDWRALDKVGVTDWLKANLGARAYDVLWQRLFHLKFYEYKDKLSAAWLGTRIKRVALSRKNLLQESLGYIEGGSETLLQKMQEFILARGGRIHLGAGIERVNAPAGKVDSIVVRGETIAVDNVVSTAPIQYVPALVPDLPEAFAARIRALENIPVVCVILKLKQPLSENFWMNICDDSIDIPGVIEYSNLNPGTGPAIVYAPFYMPKTHAKYARPHSEFIEEVLGYLPKINPAFSRDWVLASHCHRYEFAQAVCPPGFYDMLPPMQTPIAGLCMADTAYYYPEDRSICESVKVAKTLAQTALA
ncbi:protoporphyrinogen oxidase [Tahibacter aquaticus]|uniref:Protoporphyrinogen oxidase n=1 Tax=Tahibacter aquaticus TaxID=520092 RepID=A0A4R6ZAA3_9GAMM|nr:NAD(P)/FAD-dependent oxidoreductase [Tahibacter aquaticus]TDR48815.1 protoporphyrinogen oxidase [Tahibacter aquaticus]